MYTIVGLQDAGLYVQATIPPVLTCWLVAYYILPCKLAIIVNYPLKVIIADFLCSTVTAAGMSFSPRPIPRILYF